jgi:hypothetical protein
MRMVSQVLEPNKCEAWIWTTWDEMLQELGGRGAEEDSKAKLFQPLINLVEQRHEFEPWKALQDVLDKEG